ncbi:NTP transferase domain-containing protein, partial [Candidatus Bathyarchaeota archaeon]|nr:NTP transferase domain-containing protein [Candidatus Bathyarchaeota archaeon]
MLLLKNSAVILAGGFSRRFGQDKGLIDLADKPLILHVVDRVSKVANETVVVVGSCVQKEKFESL